MPAGRVHVKVLTPFTAGLTEAASSASPESRAAMNGARRELIASAGERIG
jgi:hypothetical protein